jgi:hypothetical protein
MNTLSEKEQLIADVIAQIRNDLAAEDTAPLEELLNHAKWDVLEAFMPSSTSFWRAKSADEMEKA